MERPSFSSAPPIHIRRFIPYVPPTDVLHTPCNERAPPSHPEWAGNVDIPTKVEWRRLGKEAPYFVVFKGNPLLPATFWMTGKISATGSHLTSMGDWTPSSGKALSSACWVLHLVEPEDNDLRDEFRTCVRIMDDLQSQVLHLFPIDHIISAFSITSASSCATLSAPMFKRNDSHLRALQNVLGADAYNEHWSRSLRTHDVVPLDLRREDSPEIQPHQYSETLPGRLIEVHFNVLFYPGEHPHFLAAVEKIYVL